MVCHGAQVPLLELPPSWLPEKWSKWCNMFLNLSRFWTRNPFFAASLWAMPVNIRKHNKHNTSKKMYKFHRWAGSILSQSVFFSPKQMSLLPSACCLCTARPLGAQNRNWKKTSRGRNDKLFGMQKDVVEYTKTLKKKTVRHKRFVCLLLHRGSTTKAKGQTS